MKQKLRYIHRLIYNNITTWLDYYACNKYSFNVQFSTVAT